MSHQTEDAPRKLKKLQGTELYARRGELEAWFKAGRYDGSDCPSRADFETWDSIRRSYRSPWWVYGPPPGGKVESAKPESGPLQPTPSAARTKSWPTRSGGARILDREAPAALDDSDARFRRVILRGFHHYRVEVSTVRGNQVCKRASRFRKDNAIVGDLYEARVVRGGFWVAKMGPRGMWCAGVECAGPGWDDTFGRTALEAAHKARRIARDWVRWQLSIEAVAT